MVEQGNNIYVNQRTEKDIWQNLYEFILIETESLISEKKILKCFQITFLLGGNSFTLDKISKIFTQKLTHQTITGRFFHVTIKKPSIVLKRYKPISKNELKKLAFPKFIASYLQD
jgi:A/G-specific adenine glycosylase